MNNFIVSNSANFVQEAVRIISSYKNYDQALILIPRDSLLSDFNLELEKLNLSKAPYVIAIDDVADNIAFLAKLFSNFNVQNFQVLKPELFNIVNSKYYKKENLNHPGINLENYISKTEANIKILMEIFKSENHIFIIHPLDMDEAYTPILKSLMIKSNVVNFFQASLTYEDDFFGQKLNNYTKNLLAEYNIQNYKYIEREQIKNPSLYDASDEFEACKLAATLIKTEYEAGNKKILVVIKKRKVSNFIRAQLSKWKIEINNSNHESLKYTPVFNFFLIFLKYVFNPNFKKLSAIIKHPLFKYPLNPEYEIKHLKSGDIYYETFINKLPEASVIKNLFNPLRLSQKKSNISDLIKIFEECCDFETVEKNIKIKFHDFFESHKFMPIPLGSSFKLLEYINFLKQSANDFKIENLILSSIEILDLNKINHKMYDAVILFDQVIDECLKNSQLNNNLTLYQQIDNLLKSNFHFIFANSFEGREQIQSHIYTLFKIKYGISKEEGAAYLKQFASYDNIHFKPEARPEFNVPEPYRPLSYSVTSIEKLMRDPYAYYLQYILKLKEINLFEKTQYEKEFGIFIHALMHELKYYQQRGDINIREFTTDYAYKYFAKNNIDDYLRIIWLKKLDFIINILEGFYHNNIPKESWVEVEGQVQFKIYEKDITLKAKADCIEEHINSFKIIDYKTGSIPSSKDIKLGYFPQLALEKYILENNGFNIALEGKQIDLNKNIKTFYIQLTGKKNENNEPVNEIQSNNVLEDLKLLLSKFLEEGSTYFAHNDIDESGKTKAYNHLKRYQEWAGV